jgi:TPR repeat protein
MSAVFEAEIYQSVDFRADLLRNYFRKGQWDEAGKYIRQFASTGHVRAMIAMADFEYDHGSREASLAWMARVEALAEGGDMEAQLLLACAYQRGLGPSSACARQARAQRMLEMAAHQGNSSCAHLLQARQSQPTAKVLHDCRQNAPE